MKMTSLVVSTTLAALAALAAPAVSHAETGAAAQQEQRSPHAPRMLLVAFAGPEDAMRLTAPFHHAVLLRKSGAASEVAVVVYGRAVVSVVPSVKGVPPRARQELEEALKAGIKVYACENSLQMAGFGSAPLVPGVEKVPMGAVQVARLVGQGFVPLQY